MFILPILNAQLDITTIETIKLLVDDEEITINFIRDEWNIDYCKSLDSNISFSFIGISSKLLQLQRQRKHISYVKIIGECVNMNQYITSTDGSLDHKKMIWNVPCDLYIDELNMVKNDNGTALITEVCLRGDIW